MNRAINYVSNDKSLLEIVQSVVQLRRIHKSMLPNGIRTHYHLVCKRTLNHLAKLAKWVCCVVERS